MINNIKIDNFKSLKSVEVRGLKGLNAFWGRNNSGKSAILNAILLLKQSIRSPNVAYKGALIDLGSFETVSFGMNLENTIKIEIEFLLNPSEVSQLSGLFSKFFKKDAPVLKELNLQSIRYCMELNINSLIETVSDSSGNILCKFEHFKNGKSVSHAVFPILFIPTAPPRILRGNGILDWIVDDSSQNTSQLTDLLKNILINKFNEIYFISTGRGIIDRNQNVRGLKDIKAGVGTAGENTISVIHHLRNNDPPLFEEIAMKAEEFGIKLTTQIDGSSTSLICRDENLPIAINVVDAGFGLNQILPVIVQSYIANEGSTILIEEPEMHLHEDAQYKLLDMFLDVIRNKKQVIITSHSVPLRSRTKRYYEQKDKHPGIENVEFYKISLDKDGSVIKPEPLNEMDIREGKQYMSQGDYDSQ